MAATNTGMRIAAGTSIALATALALAACSQDNAPSDAIKDAADTVVHQVDSSQAVKLAQGKYAPQDECKDKAGAEDFRQQLAAAVEAKDSAKLAALAAPDVKLDFGGGSGAAELRTRLAANQDLWDELAELMALGCGINEQGGITIPWYAAQPVDTADPGTAMLVTGERVPLRKQAQGGASESEEVSWDVVTLVGGLEPGAPFQQVKTSDGTIGYVATDKLRSLLDYRLVASSRDGRWSFTSLVAGD
jgi:hypothetical protein